MTNGIVERNLELMASTGQGSMMDLLKSQAMAPGSNGSYTAAHLFYDRKGAIQYFGNDRRKPENILARLKSLFTRLKRATFELGVNAEGRHYRVNAISFSEEPSPIEKFALYETAREFNERYGFNPEK